MLPQRPRIADKRTFGTVIGIGGSRGMAGAVAMAGKSALLAGAGLVQLAVPDPVLETVAGFFPEYTTIPCPADGNGRFSGQALPVILEHCQRADAVFIGPGLGRSGELTQLVTEFVQQITCPVVVDADALQPAILTNRNRNTPLVLTPHAGEFARLTGIATPPEEAAAPNPASFSRNTEGVRFAKQHGIVLVLKGHHSLITDGQNLTQNTTGNPGMATGGSGDVLTGLIAGLIVQRLMPLYESVCLAVHVHGKSGDLAAEALGEPSVTATAMMNYIPQALQGGTNAAAHLL
jgi:NAD(P)H-hydrate epimerase